MKPARVIPNTMIVAGLLGLLSPVIWSIRADILQKEASEAPPAPEVTRPKGKADAPVMPKSRLIIPKINVDATVVEGKQDSDLDRGPMHVEGTGIPGRPGNCCIAAHKEKWFRRLPELTTGDTLYIRTAKAKYAYVVTARMIAQAENVSVMGPTAEPTITLITCTGPAYFGYGNGRLVLKAALRSEKSAKPVD